VHTREGAEVTKPCLRNRALGTSATHRLITIVCSLARLKFCHVAVVIASHLLEEDLAMSLQDDTNGKVSACNGDGA